MSAFPFGVSVHHTPDFPEACSDEPDLEKAESYFPRPEPLIMQATPVETEETIFQSVRIDSHFLREKEEKLLVDRECYGFTSPNSLTQVIFTPQNSEQSSEDWEDWTTMTDEEFDAWAEVHFK